MSLVTVQVLLKNTFKALHTVSVELDIILVSKNKKSRFYVTQNFLSSWQYSEVEGSGWKDSQDED